MCQKKNFFWTKAKTFLQEGMKMKFGKWKDENLEKSSVGRHMVFKMKK